MIKKRLFSPFPLTINELKKMITNQLEQKLPDFNFVVFEQKHKKVAIFFLKTMIDTNRLEQSLLQPLLNMQEDWSNQSVLNQISLMPLPPEFDLAKVSEEIHSGIVFVYIEGEQDIIRYPLQHHEKRSLETAQTESIVIGPKISFSESLEANINILRWRIKTPDFVIERMSIGKTAPRELILCYMKSIANEDDVNTMRQRILDLDMNMVEDTMLLKQAIEDKQFSLFPQFDATELPDRFIYGITTGKVGVIVDNSPMSFLAPANLFTFMEATEDLFLRWNTAIFLRWTRFIAIFISVLVTPFYVAFVTYQFGFIPMTLLLTIGQSRVAVPFPPVMEALLLEFLIEVLREGGARLPTKVGQTMGVVGGIVVGQAVVQAGLTSNILIIIVAVSTLSSFTCPSYLLGTTIRLIRFPFIFLAATLGLFGIMIGLSFTILHLLRTTSLGRPYLVPIYPLQVKDFNKVFYRVPLQYDYRYAKSYQPKKLFKFSKNEAAKKKDIDE